MNETNSFYLNFQLQGNKYDDLLKQLKNNQKTFLLLLTKKNSLVLKQNHAHKYLKLLYFHQKTKKMIKSGGASVV
jgi:hypothetical protein